MDFMKVNDIQKFAAAFNCITKEELLPNVAYIKDGKITGTLFDGFSFDVPTNYIDADSDRKNKDFGLAHRTKEEWSTCINEFFKDGYNINALEEAVAETGEALGKPDYKVAVFIGTLYPVIGTEKFGNIDGKELDFEKSEDRITAMKWYFDECIKKFESMNYKHLEFAGFYWHWESIFNEDDYAMLRELTDYVRSTGHITIWAPFYGARGWNRWKEAKFDKATMQINYFPGRENLPNSGDIGRIDKAAQMTSENGMGIEMELTAFKEKFFMEALTGLKEYYRHGVNSGFMNGFHTYWINLGPKTIKLLCDADDEYIRSSYDELYKFIHKDLTEEEIWIDNSKKGKVDFD